MNPNEALEDLRRRQEAAVRRTDAPVEQAEMPGSAQQTVPARPRPMSDYEQLSLLRQRQREAVERGRDQEIRRAVSNVMAAAVENSQTGAEARQYSEDMNLPFWFAYENIEQIRQGASRDALVESLRSHPRTRRFLSDTRNALPVGDGWQDFTQIEEEMSSKASGFWSNFARNRLEGDDIRALLGAPLTSVGGGIRGIGELASLDQLLPAIAASGEAVAPLPLLRSYFTDYEIGDASRELTQQAQDAVFGPGSFAAPIGELVSQAGDLIGQELLSPSGEFIYNIGDYIQPDEMDFVSQVFNGLGQLGTAVGVSFLTRSPAAATAMFTGMGADQQAQTLRNMGLDPESYATEVTMGAFITGGAEAIRLGSILRLLPKSARDNIAQRALGRVGQQGLEEGFQEALENILQNLVTSRYAPDTGIFEGVGEAAGVGATIGAVFQGLIEVLIPGRARGRAQEQMQEEISRVNEMINASQVASSSRKTVEDFINEASDDQVVYVSADGVTSLYQSEAGREAAQAMGFSEEEVAQAYVDGADLAVPVGRITAAEAQHFTLLQDHIKVTPEAMTAAEAANDALGDDSVDYKEAFAELERQAESDFEVEMVRDEVARELEDVGVTADQARAAGTIFSAFYRTLGNATGISPRKIFEDTRARVVSEAAQARRQATQMTLEQVERARSRREREASLNEQDAQAEVARLQAEIDEIQAQLNSESIFDRGDESAEDFAYRHKDLRDRIIALYDQQSEILNRDTPYDFELDADGNLIDIGAAGQTLNQPEDFDGTLESVMPPENITMPIDPSLPPDQIRAEIKRMTEENRPIVKELIAAIDERFGTRSGDNVKALSKVTQKANRPSILAKKPWHTVAHIRDSYRFKTVIESLDDVPGIFDMLLERGIEIVKIDTGKMFNPGEWGWRIIAFDLRMPNGQLVEYYLPLKELEAQKKAEGHLLFEQWRNKTPEEIEAQHDAYMATIRKSYEGYAEAFEAALDRVGVSVTEAEASWSKAETSLREAARKSPSSSGMMTSSGERGLSTQVPSSTRTQDLSFGRNNMTRGVPSSTSAQTFSFSIGGSSSENVAGPVTFDQTAINIKDRLSNRGPVRKPRGSTYMGVGEQFTVTNNNTDAPLLVRNAPIIQASTNSKNAAAQTAGLDALFDKHAAPLSSEQAWVDLANDAFSLERVPMPPFRTLEIVSEGASAIEAEIGRLSEGMRRDAEEGLKTAKEFGEVYANGEATPDITGKAFLWSFLSRGVTPYVQEGGFLDAIGSDQLTSIMQRAAADGWSDELDAEYTAWAAAAIPPGSPGRQTQHNLNDFGRTFLRVMSQRHDDAGGRTGLQIIHDMIADGTPSKVIRREFLRLGDRAGIDNKVVSFTLLLLGRTDVLVLDRVQIRNQWNDGRFDGQNIYDPDIVDGKQVTGSSFANITFGHKGLLYYEAMEDALGPIVEEAYANMGMDGSLGRYHWDSWLLASNQEVGHASVEGLLRDAQGKPNPYVGAFVRQGKYSDYNYGWRYGVLPDNKRAVVVELLDGSAFVLPSEAVDDPKSPARKIISRLASKVKKRDKTFGRDKPWTQGLTEQEREQYDEAIRSAGTPAPDFWKYDPNAVGREGATGTLITLDQQRRDERDERVRGEGAGEGDTAVENVEGRGAEDGVTNNPVSEADLERLDDVDFLREFLTRPGWGVVTASLSLPDDSFHQNMRENNPDMYEAALKRQEQRNNQENAYLRSLLEGQGIPYVELVGMYQGEPDGLSFLVLADEATVMRFGRQFSQDSVLTRDGLIFTERPRPDVQVTGDVIVGEQAKREEFFSVLPGGGAFSMELGFGVSGPGVPVIPDGYSQRPDRPQLPIRPDGMVELYHWSDQTLTEVDPSFAGTGPLQGVERRRKARNSYFGINPRNDVREQGTGYVKERGLGDFEHMALVDPSRLYPLFEDPDGIAAGLSATEAEAAIREAGYLGYYTTDDGSGKAPLGNVAALFEAVPVEVVQTLNQEETYASGVRGQIDIPASGVVDGQAVIRLTESADISTFMHEAAHLFFEIYLAYEGQGYDEIDAVVGEIRNWLGMKPGERPTRDQHEKLAESFEQYLMEGKPPSAELRTTFSRFRKWIMDVYRSIRGKLINLDPEAIQIFDKMLVGQAEVETQTLQAGRSLPEAMRNIMSEKDLARHEAAAKRAAEQAEQSMFEAVSKKIARRNKREVRERLAEIRKNAKAELEAQPLYKVIEDIANGTGEQFNRDAVIEIIGEDKAKLLPRGRKGLTVADGGITDIDTFAERMGFNSASGMLNDMAGATTLRKAVHSLTEERAQAEGLGLMSDREVAEAANAAIHSSGSSAIMEAQLNALARKAAVKGIPAKAIKDRAKRRIEGDPIEEVMKPGTYAVQARSLHKKAMRLAAKEQWYDAMQTMQRALMQHEMASLAYKAKDEIARGKRRVARFRPTRKPDANRYDPELIDIIHRIYQLPGTNDATERSALIKYVEANPDLSLMLPSKVWADRPLPDERGMSLTDFREWRDSILMAAKAARDVRSQTKGELAVANANLANSIKDNAGDKHAETPFGEENDQARRGMFGALRAGSASIRRLSFLGRLLDGGPDAIGMFFDMVVAPLRRASNVELDYRTKNNDWIESWFDKYNSTLRLDKKVKIEAFDAEMTREQAFMIILNMGNDGNIERLLSEQTGRFTQDSLQAFLREFATPEIMEAAQEVWDYINSYWPEIYALEKRTTGVAPKKVEPRSLSVNGKTYRGGYFPIAYRQTTANKGASNAGDREFDANLDKGFGGVLGRAQTSHGHTKERATTTGAELLLDTTVIWRHLDSVAHDLAFRETFKQVGGTITDNNVRKAIIEAVGIDNYDALNQIVLRIGQGQVVPRTWTEKMFRRLRVNSVAAMLGLSVRTIATQPFGLAQTYAKIGTKRTTEAILQHLSNPGASAKFAMENSVFLRERSRVITRDVKDALVGEQVRGLTKKATAWSLLPMQFVDTYGVAIPTWLAAYNEATEDRGFDHEKAARYADQIVADTQGSGEAMDLSTLQTGNELEKMFSFMFGYFSGTLNLTYEGGQNIANGKVAKGVMAIMMIHVVQGVLAEVVLNGLSGDEDEDDLETRLMKTAGMGVMNQFVGSIPLARELSAGFLYGNTQSTPLGRTGDEMVKTVTDLGSAAEAIIAGEAEAEHFHRVAKDFARLSGLWYGVPGTYQAARIYDTIVADDDPTVMEALLTGKDQDN